MIRLYYWPTPNSHKITMMLEETGQDYTIIPVDIAKGEQFTPSFLKISPNNKMPAIVDDEPAGRASELAVFESAAILVYLAEKSGQFFPTELQPRFETLQWLAWQIAGLGPMAGQSNHFNRYAPEKLAYPTKRYKDETSRLYRVLDNRLCDRDFVAGDYSIADMAIYPWAEIHELLEQDIVLFPNVARWIEKIARRPATIKAYERGKDFKPVVMDEETRKVLLGQNADSFKNI